MGFWSSVGNVVGKAGSYALQEAKSASDRSKEYKEEMLSKSDSELSKIISEEFKRSPIKSVAAGTELKSRGYTSEQIKDMTQSS